MTTAPAPRKTLPQSKVCRYCGKNVAFPCDLQESANCPNLFPKNIMNHEQRISNLERRVKMLEKNQSAFSVKNINDCPFSRRHGYKGFVVNGYSFLIRIFGYEIKSVNLIKFIKSFWNRK